jgi:negative regulator of sigma E activity
MSEEIHEQISAFLDDELSSEQSAFLVRRLSSDALARQQTIRYATIGSILREEAVLSSSTLLRERIHAVLDGTSTAQTSMRQPPRRTGRWAQAMAGAGVAAGVAVAALLGLRAINDDVSVTGDVRSATAAPGRWAEPDSYVVPGDNSQSGQVVTPPIRLTNYLMQHGSYTSTLNRTSVHSNVIGKRDPEPAEQVNAEVEAP